MDSENSRQQPRANLHALDHGAEMLAIASNSLNEEKRLEAIRTAFEQFEADPAVKDAINNLVRHFHWCRDARNKLLHAEPYPPSLGSDPQLLYLIKRIDKRSRQSGYMKLSVDYLRSIAGKIRAGIVQSARISIYLRTRGLPLEKIDRQLRAYAGEPLPEPLSVPRPLRLTLKP